MTILGLSIAGEQHYDIVTADGVYHEDLLATKEEDVFEAVLTSSPKRVITTAQAGQELAQLVVTLTGVNYEALRPESIAELQESSRFQKFRQTLRHSASTIDREADSEAYNRQLREEAEHIISCWHDTKQDVSNELKQLLFQGVVLAGSAIASVVPPIQLAVADCIGVWQLISKTRRVLKRRDGPQHYLTQIVSAQDRFLKLTFPLGLET